MAEFLIKNFDSRHSVPEVDDTLERVGDIVEVRPDGARWARLERDPSKFIIIKCPGLDFASSLALMEAWNDVTDPENPILIRVRRWTVADAIPFLAPFLDSENIYIIPEESRAGAWATKLVDKAL